MTKDADLENKFKIQLTYPTAYKTVKDTLNFLWIEKPYIQGTMNLIAYSLPMTAFKSPSLKAYFYAGFHWRKTYSGRLPKSHMITEKAYLPYFFKTTLAGKKAYLTKGMWK